MRIGFGLIMGGLALLSAGAIMGGDCDFDGDFETDDDGFGIEIDDDGFDIDEKAVSGLPADQILWKA
jgi:hypothetical protein